MSKSKKIICLMFLLAGITTLFAIPVFAATSTNVSGGVVTAFGTYMKPQIKEFTNKVIIPVVCVVDLIVLIVKSAMAYASYKRNGQYEWHALAVLGGCLVIGGTAPLWMWGLIGW